MHRRHFLGLAGAGALGAGRIQLDDRFDQISHLIETKMAEYRVTGVAFGLSKNGVSERRGFGITNIDNPQPVTPDKKY